MTVSTEISSNEYTGNGLTTDFDYKFRIFKANQLSVITSDIDGDNVVSLKMGTDYTVTGVNKSAGGKVILTRPLTNGHKISIARDIPITQETSFRNQSKFFAETHEDAFDYLTMILQRIWGNLGSLYLKRPNILANWFDAKGYRIANLGKPKRDSDAVDLGTLKDEIEGVNSTLLKREKRLLRVDDMDISALPKASDRAGNVLTFDKDGRPIVVAPASGSAVDVLNQLMGGNGELLGLAYNDSDIEFDANSFAQLTVYADLFIEKHTRVIDGIHAACDYVKRKGGGYVHLSAKTYLLEDELIPRDTVKIIGNLGGYWSGLTTLKWAGGDGTNKCVVRASTAPLGSLTTTALVSTGVVDCHIDAEGCDVGFYSQYVTNGSEFSGLVVKNATKINNYILKSWFSDYIDISATLGKDKGTVIAQPMFGEEGQMNVNACGFSSLKAHSNGVNTPIGSSDAENGVGIILGKHMAANFINNIQTEGNAGVGGIIYSTYTNSIGALYTEKNARNADNSIKNCGLLYENGGSFSAWSIQSLHLAGGMYVICNVDLGLIIQSVGRNDNVTSFKGTGRVLITGDNLRNFSNTDWSKIASDNMEITSGKRINLRYNTSFDTMSCLLSESIGYPHIVIVPRDNYTYTNDLILRFLSHPSGANFGKEFVKDTPIIRRVSPLAKGFQKLELSSDVRTTDTYFDVYVMYAKARMGGQVHPTLTI